ncbi:zinc ribbon domain-containing protein [Berryella intestinalis]|uniref:zinc ribbon domain-containing protein n=1 Tax=Berryella intestinalis TaxID=1531429 RepID=UPI003B836A14
MGGKIDCDGWSEVERGEGEYGNSGRSYDWDYPSSVEEDGEEGSLRVSGSLYCVGCGEPVQAAWKYCFRCGTPVPEKHCVNCGRALSVDWQYCPICGRSISEIDDEASSTSSKLSLPEHPQLYYPRPSPYDEEIPF